MRSVGWVVAANRALLRLLVVFLLLQVAKGKFGDKVGLSLFTISFSREKMACSPSVVLVAALLACLSVINMSLNLLLFRRCLTRRSERIVFKSKFVLAKSTCEFFFLINA